MKRKIYSLAAVAAVIAAGAALFLLAPVTGFTQVKSSTTEQSGHVSVSPRTVALTSSLGSLQDSFRAVTQKVLPSIVEIDVTQTGAAAGTGRSGSQGSVRESSCSTPAAATTC